MSEAELYRQALLEGAGALGLEVPDALAAQLAKHHLLIRKWAQKVNLTAVLEPERAASIHGLDCLLFAELFAPDDSRRVADIGSGAGFPGIVLALARPKLALTLIEPQRKRASFLKVALAELGRADVKVIEGRLDRVAAGKTPPFRSEVLVSRATIPPLELAGIAAPYLEPGGELVIASGAGAPSPEALAAASQGSLHFRQRREWLLPEGERRYLDVLVRA